MKIVDPTNPMPKYLQIRAWLKELIESGRYQPGDKLPSEFELARMCGVNRNTLRQAISKLAAEGVLRKEKGLGTFVASAKPVTVKHKLKQISSFGDDVAKVGVEEKNIIVKTGIEPAEAHVVKLLMLGAAADSRVVAVRRLRTGDGVPYIYEESFLPASLFADILEKDLTRSMYTLISTQFGIVLARCDQTIQAVNFHGRIAALLEVADNAAGLFMQSVTYDDNNMPVEVLNSYYRGDKYVFEVELGSYHITQNSSPPDG